MSNLTNQLKKNILCNIRSPLWANIATGSSFESLIDFGVDRQEIESDKEFLTFLKKNHIGLRFSDISITFIKESE